MARRSDSFTCSFCGKGREQTRRLIAGPNRIFICAECVALCNDILAEGQGAASQQVISEAHETNCLRRSAWRRLLDGWNHSHRHVMAAGHA